MFHNVWFKDNNLSSGISNTYIRVCMRRLFILCDLSMTSKHDKPLLGTLDQVLELGSAIFNHTKGSNSSLPWNKSFEMLIFKRKKEWVIFILLRINYMHACSYAACKHIDGRKTHVLNLCDIQIHKTPNNSKEIFDVNLY